MISDTKGMIWDEKNDTIEWSDLVWGVEIEFTGKTEDNSVQRRVGHCVLDYNEGGFFKSKKLNRAKSKATIKYE